MFMSDQTEYYITVNLSTWFAKVRARGGIVRAWAVAAVSSEFICLRILCQRVLGRGRLRRPASRRTATTAKYKRQRNITNSNVLLYSLSRISIRGPFSAVPLLPLNTREKT